MTSPTRRSVSMKGATYARLKGYCEQQGVSISGFLEALIAARLDAANVPEHVGPLPVSRGRKDPREDGPAHSGAWTF